MFGEKIRGIIDKIKGLTYLGDTEIREIIRDLQRTLIAGDVDIKLVFELSKKLEKSVKKEEKGLTKKESLVKALYNELENLLGKGEENIEKILNARKILLLGLFGSGKTTTAAKLAKFYKKKGKKVVLIQSDVERPAAFEQLEQLGKLIEVPVFFERGRKSYEIVGDAVKKFEEGSVLIVDTAGRSGLDEKMTEEIRKINKVLKPDLKILVMPGDIGQAAGKQAKAFDKALDIDGLIIAKMDGSAKGGGALSATKESGEKIFFLGTGEKIDDLEIFDTQRFVARLLGYGDLQGLLEKIREIQEEEEVKIEDIERFDFISFKKQLGMMKRFGSFKKFLSMMGVNLPEDVLSLGEEKMKKFGHIIDSMTAKERKNPDLIKSSRIKRIANGAGVKEEEVRELVRNFNKMKKMMDRLKGKRNLEKILKKMYPRLKM